MDGLTAAGAVGSATTGAGADKTGAFSGAFAGGAEGGGTTATGLGLGGGALGTTRRVSLPVVTRRKVGEGGGVAAARFKVLRTMRFGPDAAAGVSGAADFEASGTRGLGAGSGISAFLRETVLSVFSSALFGFLDFDVIVPQDF